MTFGVHSPSPWWFHGRRCCYLSISTRPFLTGLSHWELLHSCNLLDPCSQSLQVSAQQNFTENSAVFYSIFFPWKLGCLLPFHINSIILRLWLGSVIQQNLFLLPLGFNCEKSGTFPSLFWNVQLVRYAVKPDCHDIHRKGVSRLMYCFLFGYEYRIITLFQTLINPLVCISK